MPATRFSCLSCLTALMLLTGCADSDSGSSTSEVTVTAESDAAGTSEGTADPKPEFFKPITLGSGSSGSSESDDSTSTTVVDTKPPKFEDVVAGLKPIQIMLGKWQGILSRSSTNEVHDWAWDLKSDPVFPALVAQSDDGSYFRELRLTFDPRVDKYLMTTTDEAGAKREFEGMFTSKPEDVPSEDGKTVHRNFKLELTEVAAEGARERWQYTFNQRDNNRYLLDVKRARGQSAFALRDVIGSQREGVSFAKADDDYGDLECVISGGLGTSTVKFNGKSYYVCCSGCAAAFNDDPERWIARFEAKQAEKMKAQ